MSTQMHTVDGRDYRTDVVQANGPDPAFVYYRATAYELVGDRIASVAGIAMQESETLTVPLNAMGDVAGKVSALRQRVLDRCVARRTAAEQMVALGIQSEDANRKPQQKAPAPYVTITDASEMQAKIETLEATIVTLRTELDAKANATDVEQIRNEMEEMQELREKPPPEPQGR